MKGYNLPLDTRKTKQKNTGNKQGGMLQTMQLPIILGKMKNMDMITKGVDKLPTEITESLPKYNTEVGYMDYHIMKGSGKTPQKTRKVRSVGSNMGMGCQQSRQNSRQNGSRVSSGRNGLSGGKSQKQKQNGGNRGGVVASVGERDAPPQLRRSTKNDGM